MKGRDLERSSYKALRYSVNLFVSRHKDTLVASIDRQDGKVFLQDIAKLSSSLGKSHRYHGWSLDALLKASQGRSDTITVSAGAFAAGPFSEVVEVHPVGPVRLIVPLVVSIRSKLQVIGVDAQAVVTTVPDDDPPSRTHRMKRYGDLERKIIKKSIKRTT